jgi:hypothetical protein
VHKVHVVASVVRVCIDKRNNAELSKAISSIERRVFATPICRTYRPPPGSWRQTETHQSPWMVDFWQSRCFTRAWTLQEPIARGHVEFFSLQHSRLGDKQSLKKEIHAISGIQIEPLRGRSMRRFPVDVRLAWADNRPTTEGEDAAYCLLGIFGVSMPLVYGEGRTNALRWLENETRERRPSDLENEPWSPHMQSRSSVYSSNA